jgi:hypothetical protein
VFTARYGLIVIHSGLRLVFNRLMNKRKANWRKSLETECPFGLSKTTVVLSSRCSRLKCAAPQCMLELLGATALYSKWHVRGGEVTGRG